jgi:predicted  nucleic acid-binding Zn-ribbon protein
MNMHMAKSTYSVCVYSNLCAIQQYIQSIAQRASSEAELKAVSAVESTQALIREKAQLQERVRGLEDEVRVAKRSLDLVLEQRSKAEGKLDAATSKLRRLRRKHERYE